jgi:hypothetical protein
MWWGFFSLPGLWSLRPRAVDARGVGDMLL